MIKRVYIKELLSFKEISLSLSNGLVVITGPSGTGKSVFINSILANFGLSNQEARLCEIETIKPNRLESEIFDLEDDNEIIIKSIKRGRVRLFINEQSISKKALKGLFKEYVLYLSVRDKSGFESYQLIDLIDNFIKDEKFIELKDRYETLYHKFLVIKDELKSKKERIQSANDRLEFLRFEINKIESINPKTDEYEELLRVKKQLSKIDKINKITTKVNEIFNYEDSVYELLDIVERDSNYFNEAMNTLRNDLEDIENLKEELSDINIKEVLDRLSDLDTLNKRFGSIKSALIYLENIKNEVISLERIGEDLSQLEEEVKSLESELQLIAKELSKFRRGATDEIEANLKELLAQLKLPPIKFIFENRKNGRVEFNLKGVDEVSINMGSRKIEHLSGGEFNRVRLALLSVTAINNTQGVIFLDELDANVSGDESIAIANMVAKLSKSFQIFAISHQPHLTAKADFHILVNKRGEESYIKVLDQSETINEIARMIGGESLQKESIEFAKKLTQK